MTAQSKDVSRFFLILTAFFGLYVRLFPLFKTAFPLVDGGMFYTMIKDLQASHFVLPVFTSYNHAEIPYAYPPLAFYVAGFVNTVTGISLLDIIKWLPVLISILTIPFFYLFVKQILNSEPKAALATLIFALTPNSYWWNIVGGGLTRSIGTLFFIITAICAYQMYREKKLIWVIGTIFGGAFVVLSHLTWALQSVVVILLLWFFWGRNKQGIVNSMIVVVGILLAHLALVDNYSSTSRNRDTFASRTGYPFTLAILDDPVCAFIYGGIYSCNCRLCLDRILHPSGEKRILFSALGNSVSDR